MRISRWPALISNEEYYLLLVIYLSFCVNLVGLRFDSFPLQFFFSFAYFHDNGLEKNQVIHSMKKQIYINFSLFFPFKSVYI